MNFKEFILLENKQEIVSLGFPKIVADIIFKYFGKFSVQVAKWNKDYSYDTDKSDWWYTTNTKLFSKDLGLGDLVHLYETDTLEEYKIKYKQIRGEDSDIEEYELPDQKEYLSKRIEHDLMNSVFFSHYSLIKDIRDGSVTDLAPYKKLRFDQAQDKYDKKHMFKDQEPIKVYANGWKWINAGPKCNLLGKMMKNCGSSGVMSMDDNRTILALFDKGNKPHVLVTYSPNEKRISGDEGVGSTPVKDKYADYVLDIARHLGAKFDTFRSKNKLLKIKYIFGTDADIQRMDQSNKFSDDIFIIRSKGRTFYANPSYAISVEDVKKVEDYKIKNGRYPFESYTGANLIKLVLNPLNKQEIEFAKIGVDYIDLKDDTHKY